MPDIGALIGLQFGLGRLTNICICGQNRNRRALFILLCKYTSPLRSELWQCFPRPNNCIPHTVSYTIDDGSSSSSSYNGSDLYDYKLPDEKKAKKHKKNKTEYGKLERMGVFKRLEIDPVPLLQMEPYAQELLVQRKIGNDLKPEQIQQMIVTSNIQATKIVNILNELEDMGMERHDFQTGYYSYQPKIDRKRLRLMKNDHVIHEAEQHPDDIVAAESQDKI